MSGHPCPFSRNREKGVLYQRGVSAGSSVLPKETKSTQGSWAQQQRHSQERRTFLQKPPSKNRLFSVPDLLMRCAKGIFAKGILGGTGFSLLRWEKGSETPFCGGTRGLRLPRSLGRSMRNEGVSDPSLPTARGSLRPFFPPQQGKPCISPNPLSEIPLSGTNHLPPSQRRAEGLYGVKRRKEYHELGNPPRAGTRRIFPNCPTAKHDLRKIKEERFLAYTWSFLLPTVELICLQSVEVLIRHTLLL